MAVQSVIIVPEQESKEDFNLPYRYNMTKLPDKVQIRSRSLDRLDRSFLKMSGFRDTR